VYPPEVKSSPDAPRLAQENLAKMGPMTKSEKIMAVTLVATVRQSYSFHHNPTIGLHIQFTSLRAIFRSNNETPFIIVQIR
jgi:di/tricarboxylate transporter